MLKSRYPPLNRFSRVLIRDQTLQTIGQDVESGDERVLGTHTLKSQPQTNLPKPNHGKLASIQAQPTLSPTHLSPSSAHSTSRLAGDTDQPSSHRPIEPIQDIRHYAHNKDIQDTTPHHYTDASRSQSTHSNQLERQPSDMQYGDVRAWFDLRRLS